MSEERARILQMVNEGKVSAEEGAKLLAALRESAPKPKSSSGAAGRWFRVRVTDVESGRTKVNVNLPLSLVNVATKVGARFSPDVAEINWDELMQAIQEGAEGKLVEVEDDQHGERVEVFVE